MTALATRTDVRVLRVEQERTQILLLPLLQALYSKEAADRMFKAAVELAEDRVRWRRFSEGFPTYRIAPTAQAENALIAADLLTLEDVAERTRDEVAALNGVGPKTLAKLEEALTEHGLSFAAPPGGYSLDEKLDLIINGDGDFSGVMSAAWEFPDTPDGYALTEFEQSIRTWGWVYGLAVGLARQEDPLESTWDAAHRAAKAASAWFERIEGKVLLPDRDAALTRLLNVWQEACWSISTEEFGELHNAFMAVSEQFGRGATETSQ